MDNDIIKQAVELAEGWFLGEFSDEVVHFPQSFGNHGYIDQQWVLDALAAQLVRQVDALRPEIYEHLFPRGHLGPDRTENTIRAIVESGVLDG